jgi:hypothetical protein
MTLGVPLTDRCVYGAIAAVAVSAITVGCSAGAAPCADPTANADHSLPSSTLAPTGSSPSIASRAPAAREENAIPPDGELHLHQYQVYTDGGEHAFVVSPAGLADQMLPADRALFFGTRALLRSHGVTAVERTEDSWSLTFSDPALAPGARASLRHVNGRTALVCDQRSRDLVLAAHGKERALILQDAEFVQHRWSPVCMGRLGDDAYVYVDRAFRPDPLYRVFGGGRGTMHSLGSFTGDEVIVDGNNFDFFVEGGVLRCAQVTATAAGSPEYLMTWERPPTRVHFVPAPPQKNHRLIMRELGVYRAALSPCDTLAPHAAAGP